MSENSRRTTDEQIRTSVRLLIQIYAFFIYACIGITLPTRNLLVLNERCTKVYNPVEAIHNPIYTYRIFICQFSSFKSSLCLKLLKNLTSNSAGGKKFSHSALKKLFFHNNRKQAQQFVGPQNNQRNNP